MKDIVLKITAVALFLMVVSPILAQPGPPPAPPATPIDGGLSLLLAAGGALGLKKLKDYKNR